MEQEVQKPRKKFYERWWMWPIYIICFFIVINNFARIGRESRAQPPAEAVKVAANSIVSEYKENGVAADAKYKGKLVEVSGTVKTIDKTIADTPYIALESYEYAIVDHVQCMFERSRAAELTSVKKGEKITLRGIVSGKFGNIVIDDCEIVRQ